MAQLVEVEVTTTAYVNIADFSTEDLLQELWARVKEGRPRPGLAQVLEHLGLRRECIGALARYLGGDMSMSEAVEFEAAMALYSNEHGGKAL